MSLLNIGIPTDFRKAVIENNSEHGHLMPIEIDQAVELFIRALLDNKVPSKENESVSHDSQSPLVEVAKQEKDVYLTISYRKDVSFIMFKEHWRLESDFWVLESCTLQGSAIY